MANLFRLRKGLDINLAGKAEKKKISELDVIFKDNFTGYKGF